VSISADTYDALAAYASSRGESIQGVVDLALGGALPA
jgi:hypothetical protein